jgi:hypothetical protein
MWMFYMFFEMLVADWSESHFLFLERWNVMSRRGGQDKGICWIL